MPANAPEAPVPGPINEERPSLSPEQAHDAALMEAAIRAVDCGLIIYDAEARIQRMNPTAERLFRHAKEMWSKPLENRLAGLRFFNVDGRPLSLGEFPVARALAGETVREESLVMRRGDEPERHLSISASPIVLPDGRRIGAVASFTDVTERIERERRLEERKEAAESAARLKGEFLAATSHEIRTPLNGVIGMAELALLTELPPEAREYVQLIRLSAKQLLDIVNDVLDFSKIESGRMELEPVEFDVRRLLETLLRTLGAGAVEKGLELRYHIAGDVPSRLRGDEGKLRQVLVNLVGNAVKFTDQGAIEAFLEKAGQEDDTVCLRFSVRDTGRGIPADKLGTIFESFTQLGPDQAGQRGTGLGLAISKRLVELMGGSIGVESEPGRGSVFSFTALFEPLPDRAPPGAAKPCQQGGADLPETGPLRILLAEDNVVNRLLAATLLEKRGHAVTAAQSGREALDMLRGDGFDVVLMDVRMPEMSGEEATRLIRSGAASPARRDVPIIALTAHALKGDRERFLAAGMDDYVSKPIDPEELDAALRRVVAARRAEPRSGD